MTEFVHIRTTGGQVIGLTRDLSDRIEARTQGGVLLGWYDKKQDYTRRANGTVVSHGNSLASLFF